MALCRETARLRRILLWTAVATAAMMLAMPSDAGQIDEIDQPAWIGRTAVIMPGLAAGDWRSRTQLVWDAAAQQLVRRQFTFWDPLASEHFDFVWTPDDVSIDHDGKLDGKGRIAWRMRGAPSYERSATVAAYRGAMRDGYAEGFGEFVHRSGVTYKGRWHDGLMDGEGRLSLANGDQYVGGFRAGKLDGAGTYIDATGTIYDGHFVAGVRQGEGLVQRPNGFAYSALWLGGDEVSGSRKVVAAVGSGKAAAQAVQYDQANDLRVGVLVDPRKLDEEDPVERVPYVAESKGDMLNILPGDERLMGVWRGTDQIQLTGDEIFEYGNYEKSFLGSRFKYEPVSVIFELENTSRKAQRIVGAYLDVADSKSDLDPAIQLVTDQSADPACDPDLIVSRRQVHAGKLWMVDRPQCVGRAVVRQSQRSGVERFRANRSPTSFTMTWLWTSPPISSSASGSTPTTSPRTC